MKTNYINTKNVGTIGTLDSLEAKVYEKPLRYEKYFEILPDKELEERITKTYYYRSISPVSLSSLAEYQMENCMYRVVSIRLDSSNAIFHKHLTHLNGYKLRNFVLCTRIYIKSISIFQYFKIFHFKLDPLGSFA